MFRMCRIDLRYDASYLREHTMIRDTVLSGGGEIGREVCMKEYDAIIVGTGIGGLAEGLLLSHAGKKLLFLRKTTFLEGDSAPGRKTDSLLIWACM